MKKVLFYSLLAAIVAEGLFKLDLSPTMGLNLKNIVLYAMLLILACSEVASGRIRDKEIPGFRILIVICLWILTNLFINQITGRAYSPLIPQLQAARSYFFEPIIMYVVAFLIVDNKRDAIIFMISIIAVFSILNIAALLTVQPQTIHIALSGPRLGSFGNPNKSAYLLCFFMPYIYYFYKYFSNTAAKILFAAVFFASIITVAMSGSRGGVLSLGLVIFSIILIWRDYRFLFLIASFILLLVYFLWESPFFNETVARLMLFGEADIHKVSSGRIYVWKGLVEFYLSSFHNIFYGIGCGSVNFVATKNAPHNMYLKILVEQGAIGFSLWALLVGRMLIFVKRFNTTDRNHLKATIVTSSCVIIMAWFFTSLSGFLTYFALPLGVASAYLVQTKDSEAVV